MVPSSNTGDFGLGKVDSEVISYVLGSVLKVMGAMEVEKVKVMEGFGLSTRGGIPGGFSTRGGMASCWYLIDQGIF
jgi:hypothetical protein